MAVPAAAKGGVVVLLVICGALLSFSIPTTTRLSPVAEVPGTVGNAAAMTRTDDDDNNDAVPGPTLQLSVASTPALRSAAVPIIGPTTTNTTWRLTVAPPIQRHPRPAACPRGRFLWVNTHTFGRHHNQLQEMINTALWARSLNRTAVLGMFRFSHKWHDPATLYNFSRVMQHYCVVDFATFATMWRARNNHHPAAASYCLGQGVSGTPMRRLVKCQMAANVPAHYDVRRGVAVTAGFVQRLFTDAALRDAPFIGLSGEIAFFMRAGLREHAAIFALLEPSNAVQERVDAMLLSRDGVKLLKSSAFTRPRATHEGATLTAPTVALREPGSFLAVHLRQRELMCAQEMNYSFTDGVTLDGYFGAVGANDRRIIRRQCRLTPEDVVDLLRHLQGQPSSYDEGEADRAVGRKRSEGATLPGGGPLMMSLRSMPLFVASDRQNAAVDEALRQEGAVFAPTAAPTAVGGAGVLLDLSMDYFMLAHDEAAYFTGNQISSVSQNVCYRRLGRGQACHGFHLEFAEYHSRRVAVSPAHLFSPNIITPTASGGQATAASVGAG